MSYKFLSTTHQDLHFRPRWVKEIAMTRAVCKNLMMLQVGWSECCADPIVQNNLCCKISEACHTYTAYTHHPWCFFKAQQTDPQKQWKHLVTRIANGPNVKRTARHNRRPKITPIATTIIWVGKDEDGFLFHFHGRNQSWLRQQLYESTKIPPTSIGCFCRGFLRSFHFHPASVEVVSAVSSPKSHCLKTSPTWKINGKSRENWRKFPNWHTWIGENWRKLAQINVCFKGLVVPKFGCLGSHIFCWNRTKQVTWLDSAWANLPQQYWLKEQSLPVWTIWKLIFWKLIFLALFISIFELAHEANIDLLELLFSFAATKKLYQHKTKPRQSW